MWPCISFQCKPMLVELVLIIDRSFSFAKSPSSHSLTFNSLQSMIMLLFILVLWNLTIFWSSSRNLMVYNTHTNFRRDYRARKVFFSLENRNLSSRCSCLKIWYSKHPRSYWLLGKKKKKSKLTDISLKLYRQERLVDGFMCVSTTYLECQYSHRNVQI